MKESVTRKDVVNDGFQILRQMLFQIGFQRGRLEEAQKILFLLGTDKFNTPPSPEQLQELEAIIEVGHLEDLAVRISHVSNWSELLASPATPRLRRRKKS